MTGHWHPHRDVLIVLYLRSVAAGSKQSTRIALGCALRRALCLARQIHQILLTFTAAQYSWLFSRRQCELGRDASAGSLTPETSQSPWSQQFLSTCAFYLEYALRSVSDDDTAIIGMQDRRRVNFVSLLPYTVGEVSLLLLRVIINRHLPKQPLLSARKKIRLPQQTRFI